MKAVVVAYPHGRCGSSATMGLLDRMGFDVGRKASQKDSNWVNPKGYYELKPHDDFLATAYPEHYPAIAHPPSIEKVLDRRARFQDDFDSLVMTEFDRDLDFALKAPRCLSVPFLAESAHDLRVLYITRNRQDHVSSIRRVWRRNGSMPKALASESFVENFIRLWESFAQELLNDLQVTVTQVQFKDLMESPVETTVRLANLLDVGDPPPESVVQDWIEPSLSHKYKPRWRAARDRMKALSEWGRRAPVFVSGLLKGQRPLTSLSDMPRPQDSYEIE